jgi:hypothetical protein
MSSLLSARIAPGNPWRAFRPERHRGEAGAFIAERNTAPGGKLPLNTNGGGLS